MAENNFVMIKALAEALGVTERPIGHDMIAQYDSWRVQRLYSAAGSVGLAEAVRYDYQVKRYLGQREGYPRAQGCCSFVRWCNALSGRRNHV